MSGKTKNDLFSGWLERPFEAMACLDLACTYVDITFLVVKKQQYPNTKCWSTGPGVHL